MQSLADLRSNSAEDLGAKASFIEIVTIALMASTLTAVAWRAFPLWDDGLIWLLSQHGGGQAVNDSIGDRPIMAKIVQLLVDSGHWREAAAVIHWLTWFGMGWVTLRLWKLLFPAHARFGLAAACVAVAPVLCRIQTILLCTAIPTVVGPVVVFLVVLPFLSPKIAQRTKLQIGLLWVVMVAAVGATGLISEYALTTVAASIVLLWGLTPSNQRQPRRTWMTVSLLLATALATYAVYHQLADPAARLEVRPEAQPWGYRLKWLAPRMLIEVWRLAIGTFLERLGGIDAWNSKEAFVGLLAGVFGALFLIWFARGKHNLRATDEATEIGSARTLLSLLAAVTVGILPVVAMGRGGHGWSTSRAWAPVLPLTAVSAVYLPLLLFRRQMWWVVSLACGFVAGFFLINDGLLAIHERDRFVALGDQLEPYVPETGLTVAVVHYTWRYPLPFPKEWEMTAQLTMNWPQTKRDHFWAFAGMDEVYRETVRRDGKTVNVLDDPFGPHPQLLRAWRVLTRQLLEEPKDRSASAATGREPSLRSDRKAEDVSQILWVTTDADGKIRVERLPTREGGLRE